MRSTQLLLATQKEVPADAEIISHQLMLRAGMIRKLASGLYTWLPLGLRVLRKIESIVREEMNRSGAQEVLMPVVQPAELWQESGRWAQYGPELLRISDRHERDFCLGPTHEEVITDLVRNEVQSYKQLPVNLYQVQTKFRDEIRPRFGVMRAREFLMKDAYSFHTSDDCLERTYQVMYQAYSTIFTRLGLDFRAVLADTGSIGGSASHEFHVLANSGEDAIAFSDSSDYAANVELAATLPLAAAPTATQALDKVPTPGAKTVEEVAQQLGVPTSQIAKTIVVKAEAGLALLVVRGDHSLNPIKAEKLPGVIQPLTLATDTEIQQALECSSGSIGPCSTALPVYVDYAVAALADFVCGANEDGFHYRGVNWQRDAQYLESCDLRSVVAGDPSPDGKGKLEIRRGIEVGHIFQLGDKYSKAMNAAVLNETGSKQTVTMGCYGIGVSRVMAAAIEQNHDSNGIIWPQAIAPFEVVLIPINAKKSELVSSETEKLYQQLCELGVDVLLDDRDERPGVKFADMELIGIPHRVVIGEKGLQKGVFEYRLRSAEANEDVAQGDIVRFLCDALDVQPVR